MTAVQEALAAMVAYRQAVTHDDATLSRLAVELAGAVGPGAMLDAANVVLDAAEERGLDVEGLLQEVGLALAVNECREARQ